jgi:hypothetical protein
MVCAVYGVRFCFNMVSVICFSLMCIYLVMDSYNSVLVQTATEHVISEHIEHVHNTVKYAYIYKNEQYS